MSDATFEIVCDSTEDRYGSSLSLEEAERIAVNLLACGLAAWPLQIECGGRVVRQYILDGDRKVIETVGSAFRLNVA